MEALEEAIASRRHEAVSLENIRKRRCPHCNNYLFLERVYGEGFWWSCLICGWEQPARIPDSR